jgi:hypothetical protein
MTGRLFAVAVALIFLGLGFRYFFWAGREQRATLSAIEARKGVWRLVPEAWARRAVEGRWFASQSRVTGATAIGFGILLLALVLLLSFLGGGD